MEHIDRLVFANPAFTYTAAALGSVLKRIGQRVLTVLALLLLTYGLLAAEVELAKLESFPAPMIR